MTDEREPLYPTYKVRLCTEDNAITEEGAKELLGWTTESGDEKFGAEYSFIDLEGNKVRCLNNSANRPIYKGNTDTLQQEHLRARWRFNGEPIIIGEYGSILNGQHSLISFVFACQAYRKSPEIWEEYWQEAPVMEKLLVLGVSEDDEVVNTLDTCRPRSLTDVLYRSEYFRDLQPKYRREAARCTDHTIRMLWARTGASTNAFSLRRTHSESLDFVARHPRVLECVGKVIELADQGESGVLCEYMSLGYLSSLLYLMGSSNSSRTTYTEERAEIVLNWDNWDTACEFLHHLAEGSPEFLPVRKALANALRKRDIKPVRWAVLIKAWHLFLSGEKLTENSLVLDWVNNSSDLPELAECPTTGGIDIGDATHHEEEETLAPVPEPKPEPAPTKKAPTKKAPTKKKSVKKAASTT